MLYELNCFILTIISLLIWLGMGLGWTHCQHTGHIVPVNRILFWLSYKLQTDCCPPVYSRHFFYFFLKCHLLSNG